MYFCIYVCVTHVDLQASGLRSGNDTTAPSCLLQTRLDAPAAVGRAVWISSGQTAPGTPTQTQLL